MTRARRMVVVVPGYDELACEVHLIGMSDGERGLTIANVLALFPPHAVDVVYSPEMPNHASRLLVIRVPLDLAVSRLRMLDALTWTTGVVGVWER